MRITSTTALTLALAACAAPKEGARRDSADSLPPSAAPAVVGETARAVAEPMPSVTPRDSAAPMPAARGAGGAAPMPNATATPPAPAPETPAPTRKKPPTRVVPDPVLPPRDSTASRP